LLVRRADERLAGPICLRASRSRLLSKMWPACFGGLPLLPDRTSVPLTYRDDPVVTVTADIPLVRHIHGDWREPSVEDLAANVLARLTGKRLLSNYDPPDGQSNARIIIKADLSGLS
jgi:hypothetical protein